MVMKAFGGLALAALFFSLFPRSRRTSILLPLILTALITFGLSACSTSVSGSPVLGGTPLGTVFITIDTASEGVGSAHDYNYQVTIAP